MCSACAVPASDTMLAPAADMSWNGLRVHTARHIGDSSALLCNPVHVIEGNQGLIPDERDIGPLEGILHLGPRLEEDGPPECRD